MPDIQPTRADKERGSGRTTAMVEAATIVARAGMSVLVMAANIREQKRIKGLFHGIAGVTVADPTTRLLGCRFNARFEDNFYTEMDDDRIARALAAEREACALDIEALAYIGQPRQITVRECAAAIRERGKE